MKNFSGFLSFSVSIDGDQEMHDKCRKDLQRNGTYDRVKNNLLSYKKKYNILPGAKIT